jgi:archaellum component FlaG (FlaF/FlaG flagellin family)
MRTKVLLCAAALAASLASSMAQNVYSLNVVGYVNVTLPSHKFTAVANPLDASMGGTIATGNDMTNLFNINTAPLIANGSSIARFVSSLNDYGSSISYVSLSKKWGSTFPMPPGTAALYFNNGAADTVVTFTGQVEQGTYNVGTLPSHQFALVGSPIPIGGNITNSTTVVGLVPANGDSVATFSSALNDWNPSSGWVNLSKKWGSSASSTIAVGQGFLYFNNSASANNWVSNFTVQ